VVRVVEIVSEADLAHGANQGGMASAPVASPSRPPVAPAADATSTSRVPLPPMAPLQAPMTMPVR
jgi:hypothetical protein